MSKMTFATWNVNSIRKRKHLVIDWLNANQPDAVCFQETKVVDGLFPVGELEEQSGYEFVVSGQKAYNGVAIAARHPVTDVVREQPAFTNGQARVVEATVNGVRLISVYVPNGNPPGGDKYAYKLEFLTGFSSLLAKRKEEHKLVVSGGDYNIAPHDSDVYDIDHWGRDEICVSRPERGAYADMLGKGYVDVFTELGCEPAFSWWDFRTRSFATDHGLRIDHFLVSEAGVCAAHRVDRDERAKPEPSDHAPVVVEVSA